MTLKDSALDFLRLASSGLVQEAYAKHVHPAFTHHNPYFPGDRASLMKGMADNHVQFPKKVFEALRAIEEENFVAVHGRVRLTPEGQDIALIHIFRFEQGKIIEEWEAAQMPVDDSPNKNGLF
jgi:predicted SnoaL-like aldol condensation-catalyzing enzyme